MQRYGVSVSILLSFQTTSVTETGLSDYHKLITTFIKSPLVCLRSKTICYIFARCEKSQYFFRPCASKSHQCYDQITNGFLKVVNKHAPIKKRTLRGNDAPFMNKEFREATNSRSRLGNKFCKYPTEECKLVFKRDKNRYESLRRKRIKISLKGIADKGLTTQKEFWKFIMPSLTKKGILERKDITLKTKEQTHN